jgi:hypothetical protein
MRVDKSDSRTCAVTCFYVRNVDLNIFVPVPQTQLCWFLVLLYEARNQHLNIEIATCPYSTISSFGI